MSRKRVSARASDPSRPYRPLATVSRSELDGVMIASIEGEIDLSNADQIGSEFKQIPNRALGLVIDIAGLRYLDSTAIALLYELHIRLARRGQQLVIVAPSGGHPRRVLELVAFDEQALLVESLEAAIAEVRDATGGTTPGGDAIDGGAAAGDAAGGDAAGGDAAGGDAAGGDAAGPG